MASTLAPTIHQGILNVPGSTAESKAAAERLLEKDRKTHHCFFGKIGFHNHLSHHLLAAYDLGAPPKLLEAICDAEKGSLSPLHLANRKEGFVEEQHITLTSHNWTEYLGQEKYYANFLVFFTSEIASQGAGEVLEKYVFSPSANGDGVLMLLRLVGGAVHPLIQTGYGVEFGSDAMVAQALAQTAVHSPFVPEIFDLSPSKQQQVPHDSATASIAHRQPSRGRSLLAILREAYVSPAMMPVMPYDPDALLSMRIKNALESPGRPEEIRRLAAQWQVDTSRGQQELDEKVEELLWTTTLLFAGTGKPGREARLDFFLMHVLNASLFVPSLLKAIPTMESKASLLRALVPVLLMYLTIRGRPRINPELLMSYTATPRPPLRRGVGPMPDATVIGDPHNPAYVNPWPAIISSVLYAPDAHTLKAIRALYYAAQEYGRTPAGGAIGAFDAEGHETHKGMAKVDGTIFVRATGIVMDTLGWVTHGQKAGNWDRSALGWDDAWKA
ncbi:uncharacterized protein LAESUDRAFT_641939 [Laetiporus sulphureus 93-53]|uniref:Oxidoreductase AflY n=1 Tax=Laetiporus sulphureus 93-53 TaxID=1314785 RepID=A0A165HP58_9APHY|nr:uncharacterized protein LAESUDRAFT_641939 [Laetiporus sulphureus 93-53]KZT11996.1 hypothetical protein LAESUDRAFT_641939 [Laetiporus sulphureus 93-53]